MQQHSRSHFFAFGILPIANVVALLIYGLVLSTGNSGNTDRSLAAILAATVLLLSCSVVSAVKRGRSLGFSAPATSAAIGVSLLLGPVFLLLVGYLALAKSRFEGTPASERLGFAWLWSPILVVAPWMALLVISAIP